MQTTAALALAFALGGLASLTGAAGPLRVTHAVLGEDRKELRGAYEIVNPRTEFHPGSPKIVCVFKVEGAGLGTGAKGIWIAEDVGRQAPPNYKIDERSLALPFINSGSVSLSKPTNGWPVGAYRLEIYVADTLAKTVKFTVKAP